MQFSKNWLKEFVDISITTEELCEQLTMAGLEVDGYESFKSKFTGKDSIINLDITPNRGDCFSHLGISRELAIIENKRINIENVILKSINAYLDVVKNKELILLSENNLLIHDDYLEVAAQSEIVSGDTLERMQVESKIFSANAKFSEVKRSELEAKATLEKLYGKEINNNFCRPLIRTNKFENLEKIISEALVVNYTILEEVENIKSQRAIISQEKSRFFPTIKVKMIHEIDDGVDVKDEKKTEDSFRLSLSYNIFNGMQDKSILQREKLFLKESQKTLDDVVNSVIEDVKINYTNYHTAKKRINYLKNYLDKNKEILSVYLEQFEGGTRSFVDILNHEAELFRAKTDLTEEQFKYTLAYYELLNLISKPYDYKSNHNNFQTIPSGFDDCYKTFCGT